MNVNKIAILGITGSGKSYLARRVAEKTGLPLFHMDTLSWSGKWERRPESEYLLSHEKILKENERWIIEGWLNEKMVNRLEAANLIIYLDYPGWIAAWRYVRRWFRHRKVARPELPAESRERFKLKWFILGLFRNERAGIEKALKMISDQNKIVRLESPRAMEAFLINEGLI